MSDIVLLIDDDLSSDLRRSSSIFICRICHEEEFDQILESPCSCSGTVKFAHRDCIQRWCNEKGNTICEICLQKFEPGYTSPPKKEKKKIQLMDTTVVTIRGSLEIPRIEIEEENSVEEILECVDTPNGRRRSNSWCRSVAYVVTVLLLIKHLFAVLNGEEESYPFSLITVLIAKASGIILPMYILILLIEGLHKSITNHYQNPGYYTHEQEQDQDQQHHHVVDVQA